MKDSMINNKYYAGFEGEAQISISYSLDNALVLWQGYFETLLECMFDQGIEANGVLLVWQVREGWYDDSPWEIPDIKEAIRQFSMFDAKKLKDDVSYLIAQKLPEIASEIVKLLTEALALNEKVYILYD